jgi:hypothetical protein
MVWHLWRILYILFKMKTAYIFSGWVLCILIAAASCVSSSSAQENDKDIKALIDAKRYVFIAQSATPTGGRLVQLTSSYDLKIRPDSIISYLPYYGRAYSAPIDPNQGGIQFTSTDFEYTQTDRKKGGWNIVIKPKDIRDPRQLSLTVSTAGYATLQVLSNDRQAISFSGYVAATSR